MVCAADPGRLHRHSPQVDIYRPLSVTATSYTDGVKRFNILPPLDIDFSDPLHILYTAAENTYLRMVKTNNIQARTIASIEYVENQRIRSIFLNKQSFFLAKVGKFESYPYVPPQPQID